MILWSIHLEQHKRIFCYFSILSCFSGKVLFKDFLLKTRFLLARSRLLLTLYFNLFMILYIRDCEPLPEQTDQAWATLKAILILQRYLMLYYLKTTHMLRQLLTAVSQNHFTKSLQLFIENNLLNRNIAHQLVHHWGHSLQTLFISS